MLCEKSETSCEHVPQKSDQLNWAHTKNQAKSSSAVAAVPYDETWNSDLSSETFVH